MSTRQIPAKFVYVCDYCGKEFEAFGETGELDHQWWYLSRPGGAPRHFCSLAHLREALEAIATRVADEARG